jgi:multidrug efflux pump subunit AcrB
MTRKTLAWSTLAAAAIAATVALSARAKTRTTLAAAASAPAPAAVSLADVKAVRTAPREEITGALNPAKELKAGFEVPGRLLRLLVKKGTAVSEGQVIAQLDPEMANAQLQQAEAAVQAAEAQAAIAADVAGRNAELAKTNTISEAQLHNSSSSAAAAAAQLQAARAQLAQARANRRRHDLRAPFAGVLIDAPDQVGKDETDIRVRLAERDRSNPDRVASMDLFSQKGLRKLSDVAQVSLQDGPSVIEHEDRERQIAVYSQLATGAALGLVTKNAILLVDGALQRLREGDDVDTALLKAGPRRLRPILMTSFAMAIGMVPTAIGSGMGSEFRSPMAIAVIGGVITSTALTLLVVPVIFAGVEKLSIARLLGRKRQDNPVLVSAGDAEEAAAARVVNG